MAEIEKAVPGSFCRIELGTIDQSAAKAFYSSLFGWSFHDFPMGPSERYTVFQLQDRDAAAAYTLRADMLARGVPPHWMLYVAVENADATAAHAGALGGKVAAGPFDVADLGRMAVIQDPTGAIFSLWQAKQQQGIRIAGEPGAMCWADLSAPVAARARDFYSALFGWQILPSEKDSSGYLG